MKMTFRSFAALCLLLAWHVSALAALNIFATLPEWASLAQEIGGDKVKVFAATQALQDPHHVEARPSLIARARNADLVVAGGADLEVGWLPVILRESGNSRIQLGSPGYFEAASQVQMLEIPGRLDRADGDVHAQGNPHVHADPRNILKVGEALTKRMVELAPADAAAFQANWRSFSDKWRTALTRWEKSLASLKGQPVVVQHKNFTYLVAWLGLKEVATLEPKPGVEPSAAYLGKLVSQSASQKPRLVMRATYDNPRPAEWFGNEAKVPVVTLPYTVGGNDKTKDLYSLFDDTTDRLLNALK